MITNPFKSNSDQVKQIIESENSNVINPYIFVLVQTEHNVGKWYSLCSRYNLPRNRTNNPMNQYSPSFTETCPKDSEAYTIRLLLGLNTAKMFSSENEAKEYIDDIILQGYCIRYIESPEDKKNNPNIDENDFVKARINWTKIKFIKVDQHITEENLPEEEFKETVIKRAISKLDRNEAKLLGLGSYKSHEVLKRS